jgi:hypothetical protein
MSTTPPEQGRGPVPSLGATFGSTGSLARLPMPGNAEFVYVVVASILLMIIAWIADSVNVGDWWWAFTAISVGYLLARGIAKASRVLEA